MTQTVRYNIEETLVAIGRVPYNIAAVIIGLFFAIGRDRTAALFALAVVPLVFAWGVGPVGVLLAVYGVLAWSQRAVQAFLR